MRSTSLRALSLGAVLSLGASLVAAQPPRPADQPPRGAEQGTARRTAGGPLLRDITLTEAQRTRVREIQQRYGQERRQLLQQVRGERRADVRAQGRDRQRPDSAERAQRQARLAQVRPQLTRLADRQYADIRAVLTGAQQATFDRNVTELKQRMAERGRGRGERGDRGFRRGAQGGERRGV